jgi:hypothetical protein
MHTKKALQGGGMKNSCQKNKKLTDSITKGHKEKKIFALFTSEYFVHLITCGEIMARKKINKKPHHINGYNGVKKDLL